jgi:hypothetical protein
VDIGIVPEAGDLHAVSSQHLDALVGAGCAADVQQCFHSSLQETVVKIQIIIPKIIEKCNNPSEICGKK